VKAAIHIAFVSLLLTTYLHAQTPIVDELARRLVKKTLFVRGFPQDERVVYDATGKARMPVKAGSWTFGQVRVDRVREKDGFIEISGRRVGQEYDGRWRAKTTEDIQVIAIEPGDQAIKAEPLIDALFIRDESKIAKVLPFWHRIEPSGERYVMNSRVERLGGKDIKPPKPKEQKAAGEPTPQPIQQRFSGTVLLHLVVDEYGKMARVVLKKPIGMGLDEKAIERVITWEFEPALKKGKPVPCAFNLEINFNLD
jgi:TonB family protein